MSHFLCPQAAELQLELSAHDCAENTLAGTKPDFYRTCTFRNLYLWRGTAYYIHEGAWVGVDGQTRERELEQT